MMRFSARRCLFSAILICLVLALSMVIYLTKYDRDPRDVTKVDHKTYEKGGFLEKLKAGHNKKQSLDKSTINETVILIGQNSDKTASIDTASLDRLRVEHPLSPEWRGGPNNNVHAFYYTWYGNPEHDGKYFHWNHKVLPHWSGKGSGKWRTDRHSPPGDIAANFYPELGAYSSKDPAILAQHMLQLRRANIGVISLSWYPPGDADDAGKPTDSMVPLLLDVAHLYGIKINFHIEPYKTRTPSSLRQNVKYILDQYGKHPAFYRRVQNGKNLPLFYIYDSYLVPAKDWAELLTSHGAISVRNTDLDALFIGLVVEESRKVDIVSGGFDGFYTYFASNGFTYGSSWKNWPGLATFAQNKGLLFVPSVGPGYIDTEVRPWNKQNTKDRATGTYYKSSFKAAVNVRTSLITITSFNEWHEGTQIEPAISKERGQDMYMDYRPHGPDYYLDLTRAGIEHLENIRK